MESYDKDEYEPELFSLPLCNELDEMPATTDYTQWINLGLEPKKGGGADSGIPASNSSDSGLSSDFHYDQQLSPGSFFPD